MAQEVTPPVITESPTAAATATATAATTPAPASERIVGLIEDWWSKPNRDCKFEVRIGQPDLFAYFHVKNIDRYNKSGLWGAYLNSKFEAGPKHYTTLPIVGFYGHLSRRIEMGMNMLYHSVEQNSYDVTSGQVDRSIKYNAFLMAPEIRWNVIYLKYLRAYVGIGLDFGVSNTLEGSDTAFDFAFNYGVTYGARIFWFMDSHIGGTFETYNVGIGYRF